MYCSMVVEGKFLIVTDCLSVINNLSQIFSDDVMTRRCQSALNPILERIEIVFMWVPGHVGIPGNEQADRAARTAICKDRVDVNFVMATDAKKYLKEKSVLEWQQRWERCNTHLMQIKPNVGKLYTVRDGDREINVKMHRLRIGHTGITHKHIYKREHPRQCDRCRTTLTIAHLMGNCPLYVLERATHKIRANYSENFNLDNCRGTLAFMKQINMYKDI
uniref:RNase H type-1 domain-containing protein n=2 Tax=Photinus pyralis TaxID=7054 RepID=A0A1Y1LJ06_PHOPY